MTTIDTDPDSERLASRFDELKHRFRQATRKLDLNGYITGHPWRAIAFGVLTGVIVGSLGGGSERARSRREPDRGKLAQAAIAGISALGMTLIKELASSQLKSLFAKWESRESQQPTSPYAG
jgi:hypothetical protein